MKKKMTYVAPETEQMTVRFEQNIMSVYTSSKPDDATLYGGGSDQDW